MGFNIAEQYFFSFLGYPKIFMLRNYFFLRT